MSERCARCGAEKGDHYNGVQCPTSAIGTYSATQTFYQAAPEEPRQAVTTKEVPPQTWCPSCPCPTPEGEPKCACQCHGNPFGERAQPEPQPVGAEPLLSGHIAEIPQPPKPLTESELWGAEPEKQAKRPEPSEAEKLLEELMYKVPFADYDNDVLVKLWGVLERDAQELAGLRALEEEWLCDKCNTVFPGPPTAGFDCALCTSCGGPTMPRTLLENKRLEKELAGLRESHESIKKIAHDLWYQGGRLRSNLEASLTLSPENWHKEGLEQRLDEWDKAAKSYFDAALANSSRVRSANGIGPPFGPRSPGDPESIFRAT